MEIILKPQAVMFTLDLLKAAHAKVKSGADFPAYIREIKEMGVRKYETHVSNGNTVFFGEGDYQISTGPKYVSLHVADHSDSTEFQIDLRSHQRGETNYPTFCLDCAKSGVERWVVDISSMTCTYFDRDGGRMLVETIPG